MTREQEIAQTIFEQLGGKKFAMFTGAKNFGFMPNGALRFSIPQQNKIKCNRVTIEYDYGQDAYTMIFEKVNTRKLCVETLKKVDTVYCDMLQEVFTDTTGYYTSF